MFSAFCPKQKENIYHSGNLAFSDEKNNTDFLLKFILLNWHTDYMKQSDLYPNMKKKSKNKFPAISSFETKLTPFFRK